MNDIPFIRYSLIIFCLFGSFSPTPLFSENGLDIFEKESIDKNSFSSTEGLLSTIIANHVSAVSGDFVENATDCFLVGPEPLSLERTYSSSPSIGLFGLEPVSLKPPTFPEGGEKYCGWQLNHMTRLFIQVEGRRNSRHYKARAFIPHRFFSQILHEDDVSEGSLKKRTYQLPSCLQKGITNCSLGAISARTNPKNVVADFYKESKSNKNVFDYCKVTFGAGDVREYRCYKEDNKGFVAIGVGRFKFVKERKANGNQIFIDENKVLKACNSNGSTIFSWLKIERQAKDEYRVLTSHYSEPIFYRYTQYHNLKRPRPGDIRRRYYLTSLSRPDQPNETFQYIKNGGNDGMLLSRKDLPANRFLEIDYYGIGDRPSKILRDSIRGALDPRCNRVRRLRAPVGHDATPITTHEFFYDLSFKVDCDEQKTSTYAGITTVYDAYRRKTCYAFNRRHRLKSLIQFNQKKPYLITKYLWTAPAHNHADRHLLRMRENPPSDSHNLMGKLIQDKDGTILIGRFFNYDDRGNILTERLYGNLTGQGKHPIELDKHKKPIRNGAESYKRTFKYSNCRFNLLLEEKEGNGRTIRNTYVPNSDLIRTKFLLDGERVCIREFYEYDENNALTTYISDNGTGSDCNDLSNVTERHITRHSPRKTIPVGLPEQTEELFIDFSTGQERLLKKIIQEYTKEGRLLKKHVYDGLGVHRYTLEWDYDQHGNIIREVNAIGQIVNRQYDENDNLIYQQGPSLDFYTTYTYDFSNRLIRTEEIHNGGEHFSASYCYDLVGNRIAKIDRYGNETKYFYDDLNRLIRTEQPAVSSISGVIYPSTRTDYDCLGNPIKEEDSHFFATHKKYTIRGKATSIMLPDGQEEIFSYDLSGNLIKKTAPNRTQTCFEVDFLGRVLKELTYSKEGYLLRSTSQTYNSFHKISEIDAVGLQTTFVYDGAGRLIQTAYHDKIEKFEYDSLGRLIKRKEPFENGQVKVTCTDYDLLDRVVEERIEDEHGRILKKVSYKYDHFGNRTHVIEETSGGISRHITDYNSDKKPIRVVDPEGNETHVVYLYSHRNDLGQFVLQTITTDTLGRQIMVTCDAMERPVNIKRYDPFGVLLANQEMIYDAVGNIVSTLEHIIVHGEEIRTVETAFSYQQTGLLTCLIEAKSLPEQKITSMAYNAFGQKASVNKSNGVVINFSYDALGRLESYASSDQSISYRYQYDQRNEVLKVDDLIKGGSSNFEYDLKGRLTTETLSNGLALSYEYDLLNRVKKLILPDSSSIVYRFDPLNLKQIDRIKNSKVLYTHHYDVFDLSGLNLKARAIDGKELHYRYDKNKRPLSFEGGHYKQTLVQYDRVGRLVHYDLADPKGEQKVQFAYDDNDHLIGEDGYHKNSYTCDSLHNRLSKNEFRHTVNPLHQLIHNGKKSFSYDLAGNLASAQAGEKVSTYSYDANDRLTTIRSTQTTHYQYDAFHRRIAKVENGRTIRYLYVGQDEIGSVDESGVIQELRVLGQGHGAEIGASIAIELRNEVFVPSHDFRGNIVCLTNFSGKAVETYRFSAFGETTIFNAEGNIIPTSTVGNPWRFSSKRHDEESGFVNFGRRYYDPDNGRWITPDPAGRVDGANLYAYLHHKPTTNFDFYGLQEQQDQQQEEPYYPLQNVDFHSRDNHNPPPEEAAPNQEPLGFTAVKSGKKSKMYYCGVSQFAELGIGFVNGMMNSLSMACDSAKKLSAMASDHFVTFLHNESHGFLFDLVRSFCELYFHMRTSAVIELQKKFDAFFSVAGPNAIYYHECHSEATIITRNVLETYPEELRKRIIVAAFAPGAYIDDT